MRDNRWQRISDLFEEALELSPAEVDAFLRRSCVDDPDLERAVRELLAADQEAGDFMQQSPYRKSEIEDQVIQFFRKTRVPE